MHMQNPILSKVIPQVLAHGHHPLKLPPIQNIRIGKPTLRSIHPHRLPGKRRRMTLRPPMNLIPFRHSTLPEIPSTTNDGDGHWSFTRTTVATPLLLLPETLVPD